MEIKDRQDLYNHIKNIRESDNKKSYTRFLYAAQLNDDRGYLLIKLILRNQIRYGKVF